MQYTNVHGLPKFMVEAITQDNYTGGNGYSATDLTKSPKEVILRKRHSAELVEDVMDQAWRFLGHASHQVIGMINPEGRVIEKRFEHIMEAGKITGQPDIFEIDEKTLSDLKITSVWSYIYAPKDGKAEWVKQLNVYAFLLKEVGHEIEFARIVMFLRDWSMRDAKYKSEYPRGPIVVQDIKLWPHEETRIFIETGLRKFATYELLPDNEIPACNAADRWAQADSWAVYKATNKTATKVCKSEEEAELVIQELEKAGFKTRVEFRQGEDRKCIDYCSVCQFCDFYNLKYGQGAIDAPEEV